MLSSLGNYFTITLKNENDHDSPPLAELTARSLLAAFALAAGLALLAGPAPAQTFRIPGNFEFLTVVLENEGRGLNDPITSLNGPLFTDTQVDPAISNLEIEALDWPGTATLGVGSGSRCAYGSGDATRLVGFHNATGTYTHGQPIATACTYWGRPKCSRTVTVRGRTYTANRGSPSCNSINNVPVAHIAHTGMFTVRIWGKVCYSANSVCLPAREPIPPTGRGNINTSGYFATFKGGGKNCGPPIWPTPEVRAKGAPPYAAWCDFTFDIK